MHLITCHLHNKIIVNWLFFLKCHVRTQYCYLCVNHVSIPIKGWWNGEEDINVQLCWEVSCIDWSYCHVFRAADQWSVHYYNLATLFSNCLINNGCFDNSSALAHFRYVWDGFKWLWYSIRATHVGNNCFVARCGGGLMKRNQLNYAVNCCWPITLYNRWINWSALTQEVHCNHTMDGLVAAAPD